MADQLITAVELAGWLHIDPVDLDAPAAEFAINAATAAVQRAARQRLVQVAGDTVERVGTPSPWLTLPQRPVTAVTSVTLDGAAVTDFVAYSSQLWRAAGWQLCGTGRPTKVVVVYDHGWPAEDQQLQTARGYTFALAAPVYDNPTLAEALAIDDYRASYGQSGSRVGLSRQDRDELRLAYAAARVGLVPL